MGQKYGDNEDSEDVKRVYLRVGDVILRNSLFNAIPEDRYNVGLEVSEFYIIVNKTNNEKATNANIEVKCDSAEHREALLSWLELKIEEDGGEIDRFPSGG